MKYLLDTHTLIWSILDIEKLSPEVRNIIENPKNEIFVSGISFWEIAIKAQLGKFNFGGINIILIPNIAKDYGFNIISPDSYDFITYGELPQVEGHKDPFDRMLIHTAIRNDLIIISKDQWFKKYKEFGLLQIW